jgi:hypothetical protein
MKKKTVLEKHQKDYKEDAWKEYSLEQLGEWISLLNERAYHRTTVDKSKKDLHDAKNYHYMIGERLKESAKELGISWKDI